MTRVQVRTVTDLARSLPPGTVIGTATTWPCPSISRGNKWRTSESMLHISITAGNCITTMDQPSEPTCVSTCPKVRSETDC